MRHVDVAATVTIAIFLAGVIYHAGRLSARLDNLESWRTDVCDDIRAIRGIVDNVAGAVTARRL